jgi:uncharacterized protein (TIGR03435 family)
MRTDLYDIAARAPEEMTPNHLQWREMIRSLLADRFQLKVHREMRNLPVYLMTVPKGGPKMKASTASEQYVTMRPGGPKAMRTAVHETMDQLSRDLPETVARPVLDRTGLTAAHDYTLEWSPVQPSPSDASDAIPSIFTAIQEQLGLKLIVDHAPVEVLVIDRLERPSAN